MSNQISCACEQEKPRASRIPLHGLVWIFIISSIIGVVVETVFCFVFKGYLECRQGVIYGPFNQVYGLGAVILAFVLLHVKNRGAVAVFLISALIGGLFETACSIFQEMIFGTVSWDYSWMSISLFGGRTNLLYMLFFGLLGVTYIYLCFPALAKLSDRIYKGKGIALTWLMAIFMAVNLCLSAMVVSRWIERQQGKPAIGNLDLFVDSYYSDDMLKNIFPTMVLRHQ